MRIGIITAMTDETMPLYEKLGKSKGTGKVAGATVHKFEIDGNEIYLAKSGVGEIRAALTAQMLVDIFEVEVLLNFGFVGSLDSRFDVGDMVLVGAVVHYQFDTTEIDNVAVGQYDGKDTPYFHTDTTLIAKVQNQLGGILPVVIDASGDKFVASSEEKNYLRTFGAHVCEMECAGLVIASERNNVPLLSIKVISDKADESANVSFGEVVKRGLTKYEQIFPAVLKAITGENSTPLPPVKL
ncbi:MAG: 5'-methylthioadenosine/S-adenosylhomocysteine nucleosidase [Clostridia bacterium]|nr:5'-methylthioadenosine/S-adenosylhomocysteine nucleosidase [Clostridia bacterium]